MLNTTMLRHRIYLPQKTAIHYIDIVTDLGSIWYMWISLHAPEDPNDGRVAWVRLGDGCGNGYNGTALGDGIGEPVVLWKSAYRNLSGEGTGKGT